MKRALLVILLGLAACSFSGSEGQPGPGDDGMDDPDGGQVGGDPDDKDGDKVKNDADNCPSVANAGQEDGDGDKVGDACDSCRLVANPMKDTMGVGLVQRDHDGDGRGDECDLCPHLKAAEDTDADGDGIGTACDPNDAVKNPPALFNGFYEAPVAAEWTIPGGAGALTDWELVFADGRQWWKQKTLTVGRRQLLRNLPDFREVYVDSVFRIHDISPAMGPNVLRSAAVTYGFFRAGGNDLYFNCGARQDVSNTTNEAMTAIYSDDILSAVSTKPWTGAITNRDIHSIGESIFMAGGGGGDSRLLCRTSAAPDFTTTIDPRDSTLFPDGKVGLRTYGMTASFDYLFMVNKATAPATAR
jgi:Thrombospondin type 3 repeat